VKHKMVHMYISPLGQYLYYKKLKAQYGDNLNAEYKNQIDTFIEFYEVNDGNITFDINDGYFKIK